MGGGGGGGTLRIPCQNLVSPIGCCSCDKEAGTTSWDSWGEGWEIGVVLGGGEGGAGLAESDVSGTWGGRGSDRGGSLTTWTGGGGARRSGGGFDDS